MAVTITRRLKRLDLLPTGARFDKNKACLLALYYTCISISCYMHKGPYNYSRQVVIGQVSYCTPRVRAYGLDVLNT